MGCWAEGWGVWKGGVLVSCWEEFGRVLWSVVRRILGERELDSGAGGSDVLGVSGWMLVVE